MKPINIIVAALCAVLALIGFFGRKSAVKALKQEESPPKKLIIKKDIMSLLSLIGSWLFVIELSSHLLRKAAQGGAEVSHWHNTINIFGYEASKYSLYAWAATAVIVIFAFLFRLLAVPKMEDVPRGAQSFVEWMVDVFRKRRQQNQLSDSPENAEKSQKRKKRLVRSFIVLVIWVAVVGTLTLIFGKHKSEGFKVSLWAERVYIFGFNLSSTVICTWVIMALLIVLAVLFRIFVVPRMKDLPNGLQNIIELSVESVEKYTDSKVGKLGDNLGSYIFTVAVFMVSCAAVELFGVRAPTADITLTFTLAVITFILINYYGIKRKGVLGRIKSMASPTPIVFPIKIVTDLAIPVSLACRLFGNMLGGMIVMDLLYMALGNAAVGIPSILGLYFNVFHPLIQKFIFVTLSLTFINEAVE
jgi:F-type H+-transporting ATPase subunit a